jgi:tetratricopeptide (TPR) repeat protein
MKGALAGGALVVVLALLWLTLAWVPADGELFGWRETTGELSVPDRGLALLPRWAWKRFPAGTLEGTVPVTSRDGLAAHVRLRWRPLGGVYQLHPAADPASGFEARVAPATQRSVERMGLACLAPAASLEIEAADRCPADAGVQIATAVAQALGSSADRLRVAFEVPPDSLRGLLLARIAADLPAAPSKVLVLGLDGLDWDLVLPWVQSGRMPNLQRLLEIGTWGVMETLTPMLSPLIWTSMATGVAPDEHGILDFVEKDVSSGQMVPVTARQRRAPALWNLASALGRTVAVVGWWGSWPADRVAGTLVSDRLYYTLTQGLEKSVLRQDLPDLVFPAARQAEFVALRDRAVGETDFGTVRHFIDIEQDAFEAAVAADRGMDDPIDGFRRLLAATRTYLGAGLLLAEEQPDLAMVYLEGTDTVGHLLAPYLPPPTLEVDPQMARLFALAVPRYFEIVDRWLGRYLEAFPLSEYAIVLVSDHGFKWGDERPRGLSGTAGPTAPLWHAPDAVYVVAGKGVESLGRRDGGASIYDLTPTVAVLLGIPPDPGWRGTPFPGCPAATLEPLEYLPLVPPESYRQDAGSVAPVDPEFIAKLRALGYLSGGESAGGTRLVGSGESAESGPGGRAEPTAERIPGPDVEEIDGSVTRAELNNLAIIKMGDKRYDEAEDLLRQAIAMSPAYASPHYNLRRLYMETERYDDADRELWIAVDKGLRDPERTIDRAAADYESLGLEARAEALLEEARRRFPQHEPFWVHSLVVKIRRGQCAEGAALGREAAGSFPSSAPVQAFLGLAAACAGDEATARSALERSLALNPNQPTLRKTLDELSP